ncbi:ATP-binding cassette domain-containing protein [Sinorhizobium meliloti]
MTGYSVVTHYDALEGVTTTARENAFLRFSFARLSRGRRKVRWRDGPVPKYRLRLQGDVAASQLEASVEGVTLGLVGENGVGKSTLMEVICGPASNADADAAPSGRTARHLVCLPAHEWFSSPPAG